MLASANLVTDAALLLAEALPLLRQFPGPQAVVLWAMVALVVPLQQHCLRIASLESACWPRAEAEVADGAALVHRLVQEQRACAPAALTCHAQGQASQGRFRTARAGNYTHDVADEKTSSKHCVRLEQEPHRHAVQSVILPKARLMHERGVAEVTCDEFSRPVGWDHRHPDRYLLLASKLRLARLPAHSCLIELPWRW